ncbi:hypothetical protein Ana3638_19375 [Anaerocolumna sedimenticola]|uniref:Uncharacterized protein n=1 Tax=Anaerocolumna sedimenticola TaxID=2696063 RepID=A0A6P1TU61_9FIRM|nr:hypothetical protein Ana3638_19375 [Anaerocolumna sedimenticola]
MEDGFSNLANAIIIQAVKDYREAIRFLKTHPHTPDLDTEEAKTDIRKITLLNEIIKNEGERDDVERFFRSGWFKALTSLDGEAILKQVREMEVG